MFVLAGQTKQLAGNAYHETLKRKRSRHSSERLSGVAEKVSYPSPPYRSACPLQYFACLTWPRVASSNCTRFVLCACCVRGRQQSARVQLTCAIPTMNGEREIYIVAAMKKYNG